MFTDMKQKINYCVDTISVVPFAKAFVALIVLYITGVIEYSMFNHGYILFFPIFSYTFQIGAGVLLLPQILLRRLL